MVCSNSSVILILPLACWVPIQGTYSRSESLGPWEHCILS